MSQGLESNVGLLNVFMATSNWQTSANEHILQDLFSKWLYKKSPQPHPSLHSTWRHVFWDWYFSSLLDVSAAVLGPSTPEKNSWAQKRTASRACRPVHLSGCNLYRCYVDGVPMWNFTYRANVVISCGVSTISEFSPETTSVFLEQHVETKAAPLEGFYLTWTHKSTVTWYIKKCQHQGFLHLVIPPWNDSCLRDVVLVQPPVLQKSQLKCEPSTACKNYFGTLPSVRLAKTRMAFSDKQNYHWMVASDWRPFEKYAIGHDISNRESRPKTRHRPSSNTKLDRPGKLVAAYNFAASLFCSAPSVFRILLDHLCSNATNDQQGLEEQLASTSLEVAPVRFVRPG